MSANDYYGGGSGQQQSSSQYGSHSGNYGGPNTPFSPPPAVYTSDSSAQHPPYPGSAQPSYDQQNASAGYSSYSSAPDQHGSYGGGSSYPSQHQQQQQDYGRPHSPYQQQQPPQGQYDGAYQNRDPNQGQGYGYGGYQGSGYDHSQPQANPQSRYHSQPYNTPDANAGSNYAARFGGTYNDPTSYSSGPNTYAQPGTMDPNGEKGLLGALGGGAVGGYAGHQVNHGFLGAVGGAITGSMAEDAWKKQHKKGKKDKKDKKDKHGPGGRRNSSSSSSSSSDSSDSDGSKKKHKQKKHSNKTK